MRTRNVAWWVVGLALVWSAGASAEPMVYYVRHAEGGHNVRAEYVRNKIPTNEWPHWVGNANVFTPKGLAQIQALATNLMPFRFDVIAVSPLWRTRNTILPYLKATGKTAEIWPELEEAAMVGDLSAAAISRVDTNRFFNRGAPIALPPAEQPYFHWRAEESGHRHLTATNAAEAGVLARKVEELLRTRFGKSDRHVLLVGHGTAGLTLVRQLTHDSAAALHHMGNTHLWLVQENADGTFALQYHDQPADKAAQRELNRAR